MRHGWLILAMAMAMACAAGCAPRARLMALRPAELDLSGVGRITVLDFQGTGESGKIARLALLAQLSGSEVVDAEHAAGLTQSLALDADWKGGDEGLAALRDLPSLAQISIQGAPLTDAALPHFASLPKLAELNISETKFSAAALRKLRADRKNLRIIARGPGLLGVHAEMTGPCVLSGIHNGSGAETAGLKAGDQVVAIDGNPIEDFSDLTIAVYARAPGETLKVEVQRDGKKRAFDVVLKGRGDLER